MKKPESLGSLPLALITQIEKTLLSSIIESLLFWNKTALKRNIIRENKLKIRQNDLELILSNFSKELEKIISNKIIIIQIIN
jgi:hypothetical protein